MTTSRSRFTKNRFATFMIYALMVVVSVAIFWFIRMRWAAQMDQNLPEGTPVGAREFDDLLHVLLALAVVIVTARLIGAVFKFLHQPPVIGEVIGGIILGPSLLGLYAPAVSAYVLPKS